MNVLRTVVFCSSVCMVALPLQTSALSCVNESFAERFARAQTVAHVQAKSMESSTVTSGAISARFVWNIEIKQDYKGNLSYNDTIIDEVWSGGSPDVDSRFERGKEYIVFLGQDDVLGMCDYPRDLAIEPLSAQEKRILNATASSSSSSAPLLTMFTDVTDIHPFYEAIQWGKNKGIVTGYNDGTFKPDSYINRVEFVKILVGSSYPSIQIDTCDVARALTFVDTNHSEWYSKSLCIAVQNQLVSGDPAGTFRPSANINAAEAAKIIVKHASSNAVTQSKTLDWYTPFISYLQVRNALPLSIQYADQKITRAEMLAILYALSQYSLID